LELLRFIVKAVEFLAKIVAVGRSLDATVGTTQVVKSVFVIISSAGGGAVGRWGAGPVRYGGTGVVAPETRESIQLTDN
jgi:hypothetical protein